jgi:cytochrome c
MKVPRALLLFAGISALLAVRATDGSAQEVAPTGASNVWSGVYTKAQGERGQALYLEKCSKCHTATLVGQPPAPPLRGSGFMLNWNGKTIRDLQSRIRSTMPADLPGSLSRPESLDIAAFILSANTFPAGDSELAGTPAQLSEILIMQTPPNSK